MGSLIVSYGGNTIHTSSADETFTLQTSGKYASDDITLTGTDVTSMTITYGGQTIDTGTGSFTHKLLTSGKLISGDIGVTASFAPQAEYFITFSSPSSFTIKPYRSKGWNGTLEYSTDKTTWATWTGANAISSVNNVLYLRGIGNTVLTGSSGAMNTRLDYTGSNITCSGNIETLLDYQTVANGQHPTMGNYAFYNGFGGAAISSVDQLIFPDISSTLPTYCFGYMFWGSSITTSPVLPAKKLGMGSYCYMFSGCSALATAPELPATTVADSTYKGMFQYCTSLNTIPAVRATQYKADTCTSMFEGCSNIKLSSTRTGAYQNAYRIPPSGTGTANYNSFSNMFKSTGGTLTGTPTINTTYYTSNTVIPAT